MMDVIRIETKLNVTRVVRLMVLLNKETIPKQEGPRLWRIIRNDLSLNADTNTACIVRVSQLYMMMMAAPLSSVSDHRGVCIPIVIRPSEHGLVASDEGVNHYLIELQGSIELDGDALNNTNMEAMIKLNWDNDYTPVLHIGQQVLYGTKEILKKPLLLVKKHRSSAGGRENASLVVNELEFIQTIRERLTFRQRPQHYQHNE